VFCFSSNNTSFKPIQASKTSRSSRQFVFIFSPQPHTTHSNKSTSIHPQNIQMAAAPFITDLPIECPAKNGSNFNEPYTEPFLTKHSAWYRRHSKAQPVTEADLATEGQSETRSSSVASEAVEPASPAAATEPQQGVKHVEQLAKEKQKPRRSSVVKALRWAFWYNGNE
jgi:hypothetical protein